MINRKNGFGRLPIHYTAECKKAQTMRLILRNGAGQFLETQPTQEASYGPNPMQMANTSSMWSLGGGGGAGGGPDTPAIIEPPPPPPFEEN